MTQKNEKEKKIMEEWDLECPKCGSEKIHSSWSRFQRTLHYCLDCGKESYDRKTFEKKKEKKE